MLGDLLGIDVMGSLGLCDRFDPRKVVDLVDDLWDSRRQIVDAVDFVWKNRDGITAAMAFVRDHADELASAHDRQVGGRWCLWRRCDPAPGGPEALTNRGSRGAQAAVA